MTRRVSVETAACRLPLTVAALAALAAFILTPATAQDDARTLAPVFEDDFSGDSRSDYVAEGLVTWKPGRLTLSDGASVQRAISGGAWAKVELDVALEAESPDSELQVWFSLDGATDCFVRFRKQLVDGARVTQIAVVDTAEQEGKRIPFVVREKRLPDLPRGRATIEYRYGVVRVSVDQGTALLAYIPNGGAAVQGSTVRMESGAISVDRLAASAMQSESREYTDAEQRELKEADEADAELRELFQNGQYAAAAEKGLRIREIRGRVLGKRNPRYAENLTNLSVLYEIMGDRQRSEELFRESLRTQRSTLGPQHPDYAMSLRGLGNLRSTLGDYAEAESLYRESMKIDEGIFGKKSRRYAENLHCLASLSKDLGDYRRAESLYREAIEVEESLLVGASATQVAEFAVTISSLAGVYQSMGEYAQAVARSKQALELQRSVLPPHHPRLAEGVNGLATAYALMGEYARAEPLYRQAGEIWKATFGERHPKYASALNNRAKLYESRGILHKPDRSSFRQQTS